MAEVMKLVDGDSNEIAFSPLRDYKKPQQSRLLEKYAIDGTLHLIKIHKKLLYNIPLNAVVSANYAQFLDWWQGLDVLTFYPDLINTPLMTIDVKIINTQNPFRLMANPSYYEGNLSLKEI